MEKAVVDWEQNTLLIELIQGKELAEQLKSHQRDPCLSPQDCHFLIEKILSSYEKALSMLKWGPSTDHIKPISQTLESPPFSGSPKSDQFRGDVYKKRKTQPRLTGQVKIYSGTGTDGPLYDGYSWRKYGQKDILGANFPRAYYRCTHRHSQGCLAIKQVQKSDEDPTIFEVTYRGRHTCVQSQASLSNTCPEQIMGGFQIDPLVEEKQNPFTNIGEVMRTEVLDSGGKLFPSFSFPYSSIGNGNENQENSIFMDSITPDNNLYSMDGNGLENNLYNLTEIVSGHTSVNNSLMGDFEITIQDGDFNYGLPFDISEFLDLHKHQ